MSFKLEKEKKETENKTIRFPIDLIQDIEHAIKGTSISFSSFVIQACKYALKNIDTQNK